MLTAQAVRPSGPPYLLDLTPPVGVSAFERNPARLIVAARHSYERAYRVLHGHTGDGFATVPRFTPLGEVRGPEAGEGQSGGPAVETS